MQSELSSVDLLLRQMQDRRDERTRARRAEEARWRRGTVGVLARVRDLLAEQRAQIDDQAAEQGDQAVVLEQLAKRRPHLRRALPPVTALAVGGQLKVSVTWDPPMPTDTYDLEVVLPPVMVGKVTRTSTTSKTGATITLKATAVVLTAGTLDVTAYALH